MFEVLQSLMRLKPACTRHRFGPGLLVAACLVVAGCVAQGGDERSSGAGSPAIDATGSNPAYGQRRESNEQTRIESSKDTGHITRGVIPEMAGPYIARDMAASLSNLFQRSSGSLPRVALAPPAQPFDLDLIDGLQLEGFKVFLDKGETANSVLSYRLEPHVNGVVNNEAKVSAYPSTGTIARNPDSYYLNDYRFILVFNSWILSRDYRISENRVRPLAPVNVIADPSPRQNRVSGASQETR